MTNPEVKTYEQLKSNEGLKTDDDLKKITDQIDALKKNQNASFDKLYARNSAENSTSKQLDNGLKQSLMKCDASVVDVLVKELSNFKSKDGVDDLLKLLNGIQQQKFSEKMDNDLKTSFKNFENMIVDGNLNKLNALKDGEIQDVINFVNSGKDDIASLNLYADMFIQMSQHFADKDFRRTDRKNFNNVFVAIKEHFKIPDGAGNATLKDMQLNKIFGDEPTSDGLKKIVDEYLGIKDWDGKELKSSGNFANGVKLIANYDDFVNRFNGNLKKLKTETNVVDNNPNEKVDNSTGKFDGVVEGNLVGKNMDEKIVNSINGAAGNYAFLNYDNGKLSYNLDNVKNFLLSIDIKKFNSDFTSVGSDTRKARLSAVQILLNQKLDGKNKLVVDGQYKRGGKTYDAVLNYQKDYNETNKDNPLKEDGIPGPRTLYAILNGLEKNVTQVVSEGGGSVDFQTLSNSASQSAPLKREDIRSGNAINENKNFVKATQVVSEGGGNVDIPTVSNSVTVNGSNILDRSGIKTEGMVNGVSENEQKVADVGGEEVPSGNATDVTLIEGMTSDPDDLKRLREIRDKMENTNLRGNQ